MSFSNNSHGIGDGSPEYWLARGLGLELVEGRRCCRLEVCLRRLHGDVCFRGKFMLALPAAENPN